MVKKINEKVENLALKGVVRGAKNKTRDVNPFGWPPFCIGLYKQNKRPDALRKEK